MKDRFVLILFISILLNITLVTFNSLFILKKGGLSFLRQKTLEIVKATIRTLKSYYPPNYLRRKGMFEVLPHSESNIVFLGDSITEECEWAEILKNSSVQNRGISGDTTDRVLNRLEEVVNSKPKKIFLMVGINDLISSGESVQNISKSYRSILLNIQAETPNTKVFIQSVLPVNNNSRFWVDNGKVLELNLCLTKLAHEFSFQYIDLFSHLSNSQGQLDTRYTEDGVHLNGQAYLVWKEVIKEYVFEREL